MKPNTKSLDEILDEYFTCGEGWDGNGKAAILDWHNKQVEEVLDRLEAQFVEEVVVIFGKTEVKKQVPLSAIEAERNLKTGKKILLPGQKERN